MVMLAAFLLVGGTSAVMVAVRRNKQDLTEYLEPPLRECGVTFISAVYPGLFKVGPFPKFEVEVTPQTNVGGIRGEYLEYRIVTFKDSGGQVYQVWACVEFVAFQLSRIRWRAESTESLPPRVAAILENAGR